MTRFNYGGEPIVAYRKIQTLLPIFRTRHKRELESLPLFEYANIHIVEDDIDDNPDQRVDVAGYEPYTMRLPYTAIQWERYKERMEAERAKWTMDTHD